MIESKGIGNLYMFGMTWCTMSMTKPKFRNGRWCSGVEWSWVGRPSMSGSSNEA